MNIPNYTGGKRKYTCGRNTVRDSRQIAGTICSDPMPTPMYLCVGEFPPIRLAYFLISPLSKLAYFNPHPVPAAALPSLQSERGAGCPLPYPSGATTRQSRTAPHRTARRLHACSAGICGTRVRTRRRGQNPPFLRSAYSDGLRYSLAFGPCLASSVPLYTRFFPRRG